MYHLYAVCTLYLLHIFLRGSFMFLQVFFSVFFADKVKNLQLTTLL